MNQKHLGFISSGFMGFTLFITLFLIYKIPNIRFYLAELFIILNIIKDIIMHKVGYTFRTIGIKKMLIVDIILLIIFVSYKRDLQIQKIMR